MDVTMPQLGETVTEGTITKWFKQVGEKIDADEPLFEVSTDKVDSEVPAPAGRVRHRDRRAGGRDRARRRAPRGDLRAGGRGAAPPRPRRACAGGARARTGARARRPPAPRPGARACAGGPGAGTAPRRAAARARAGTRARGARRQRRRRGDVADRAAPDRGAGSRPGRDPRQRRRRPDHAQRRARRGPRAAARRRSARRARRRAGRGRAAAPAAPPVARAAGDEIVPFDNIRRRTAEHMVRSLATSAHVYTSVRVDFERVERVRRAHQAEWTAEEGFALTYLPFITRAFCDVVHDYPHVNASVEGETLIVHRDINLGIAVDLQFKGLIAPVIRSADGKRLRLIAREIRDLAARAKSKQLSPDEIVGGTFTITNMGPFGTAQTFPIINQPQVAIMATDGIRKEPVVVEGPDGDDAIAVHHVGFLSLAWDHRAFDGAYAASFLNALRVELETHDWEAELA